MKPHGSNDVLFIDAGPEPLTSSARGQLARWVPHHYVTTMGEALAFLESHSPMLVLMGCAQFDHSVVAQCSVVQHADPAGRCPMVLVLPEASITDANLMLPGVVGFVTRHDEWQTTAKQLAFVASAAARYRKFEWEARTDNLARQAFSVMHCNIDVNSGECRAEASLLNALGLADTLDSNRPFHWERLLDQFTEQSREEFAAQVGRSLETGEGWRQRYAVAHDPFELECCGFAGKRDKDRSTELTLSFRKSGRKSTHGNASKDPYDPNGALLRKVQTSAVGSVLLIRIENQHELCRTLGYGVYGRVIQATMKSIEASVRSSDLVLRAHNADETVVHICGAELLVILDGVPEGSLLNKIVKRIGHALSRPLSIDAINVPLRVLVGSATWPGDGLTVDKLLNAAAQRINARLSAVDEDIAAAQRAIALESDLYKAIDRNELELHFQPKYRLDESAAIVGAEALLRWRRGGEEWIPPDVFIPIAEGNGLITTLGNWVIDETVRAQVHWRDQGLGLLPMSINVSAGQFLQPDLVHQLVDACRRGGVTHKALEIEITESCLIDQPDQVIEVLNELKSLGFGIALDDFGTGYSSLSYLRTLPLDVLKIDRSFVQSLEGETYDPALTAGIIGLGLSLGLRIVAEGVETESQWRLLMSWGCHHAQGFLMSRPLPIAEFSELLSGPAKASA